MLSLTNLSKKYKNKEIFDNVSIDFFDFSKIYCLFGESGSGKTTLFNIIFGLDQDYSGEYLYNGTDAKKISSNAWDEIRSNEMRMVYQDFKLLEALTVKQNLIYSGNFSINDKDIDNILTLLDIKNIENSIVKNISGGEKQRLSFARAIISNPKILLLDEPTDNLDEKNVLAIMDYLQSIKRDKIIIIISHDERIKQFADEVYVLKNKKIHHEVSHHFGLKEQALTSSVLQEKKKNQNILYTLSSMKTKFIDIILTSVPIIIVFCVFILGINFIRYYSIESLDTFFSGIDADIVVLDTSNFTNEYSKKMRELGIVPTDDGSRIGFSEGDLRSVLNIEGVKDAQLFNASTTSLFDINRNKIDESIEKDNTSESLRSKAFYSSLPKTLRFTFATINIPYGYSSSYNPKNIKLVAGKFPQDKTSEIVIPDVLFDQKFGGLPVDTVLNQNISLNIIKNSNDKSKENYKIVGVYHTNSATLLAGVIPVYTAYSEYSFLDLFLKEENYEAGKRNDFEININVKNYENPLFSSYETYKEAIGTNLNDLIIRLDNASNAREVSDQIKILFPNLKQLSQYDFKHGEFKETYRSLINQYVIISIISISIVALFIFFTNKNYIKRRNKELAILYSLGYSSWSVKKIILLEYFITTSINIIISLLLLLFSYYVYFMKTNISEVFIYAYSPTQIITIVIFLFFTIYISVLFALNGLKKKNLIKYLKEN